MVAAKGPNPETTMYQVCLTLEEAWSLDVLCPCRDKNPKAVCHGACMTGAWAYHYTCPPVLFFCHAHPNALNGDGALKFSAPFQSFWATSTYRTRNVFLSALSNALPFIHS